MVWIIYSLASDYSDQARHPEDIPVPGVLIVRFDGPCIIANAMTICDQIKTMIEKAQDAAASNAH